MWPKVINKVKVTHHGEGHIKVKVKISSSLPMLCKILLFWTRTLLFVRFHDLYFFVAFVVVINRNPEKI